MRTILFLLLCLAPGAVMAQSEVCNSSWTVSVVTAGNGRLLTASGGSWSMNLKDVGSLVVISTAAPYYLNTNTTLSLYCIGSGTNITSKVVLTQCK